MPGRVSRKGRAAKAREPIAIIGIGCRLPGAANVQELWDLLDNGRDAVGEYPGGRFPLIDAVYAGGHPAGEAATRRGGFLPDIDKFDAGFFGISAREAAFLDPQHRLFLETAWEAVEDAGLVRDDLAGSLTSVFAGVWSNDYETCIRQDTPETDFYSTIGSGRYSLSGRLSYILDLRGPSLTLDSGCSASLAAIHMACRSIQTGDAEMALAGGANVILRPDITLAYSAAGMVSPDGRCRFGDAAAAGYVRGEGSAVVAPKPLRRALADGDRIYAVIRGSAVNNDGRSSGLLVSPSRTAQEELIRTAVAEAGIAPSRIEYVEAHGTGTPTGDPVEIEAIGRAFSERDGQPPVLTGSIKTNIGHTESAAGVAGLIKVALALHHGRIPKSLHYETPNPKIPWSALPVRIASEPVLWGAEAPHYATVNSFGITGTNACVVVSSAPEAQALDAPESPADLLTISAHTEEALRDAAINWERSLREAPEASLHNICYTAARRRTHQERRLAIIGASAQEMARTLAAWAAGDEAPWALVDRVSQAREWKLGFVFSGAGGQWARMGTSLYRSHAAFRQRLEECAQAIQRHGGPDVLAELHAAGEASRMADAEVCQPAIWAVQLATVALWEWLGVSPHAVMGHSLGEVGAAVACGALALEEGATIVCHRSRLSKQTAAVGRMAIAGAPADLVTDVIAAYPDRISIAGINSSQSTVISGDPDAVDAALSELERRDIFCRKINSDIASHSPYMEEARRRLEVELRRLAPRDTAVEFYSASTGERERGSSLDAGYWGRNLRQPVLFWPAFQRMLAAGCNAFVEIGPHPVLLHSMQQTIAEEEAEVIAVASLRRDVDEYRQTLAALASLHNAGYPTPFSQLYPTGRCVSLPTYPWQRERHWLEIREPRAQSDAAAGHLYKLRWEEIAATVPTACATAARVFVALGSSDTADRLATELRAGGLRVIQAGDMQTVSAVLASGELVTDVVHAECTSARGAGEFDLQALWEAQRSGVSSLIEAVQVLARASTTKNSNGQAKVRPTSGAAADRASAQGVRLWVVTMGTAPVNGAEDGLRIENSPVAGLAAAIRREHPEVACRHLDLGEAPTTADVRLAAQILNEGTPEQALALRGGRVWTPRYSRLGASQAQPPVFRSDASYLISGGLGGVGIEVAEWLARRGARHLILAGRRPPLTLATQRIEKLRGSGIDVRAVAADLASDSETARLMSEIQDMPSLRGVFHAAAVAEDALLINIAPEQVARVLAPKMAGAWNLHHHTLGLPLDCFALFSSIAVPVTQPGQGVYAAANSFLDAFAFWRRSQGLPSVSVQWAEWAGTGFAAAAGMQRNAANYRARGIHALSRELGVELLGHALGCDCACALAAPVSWKTFADSYSPDEPPRVFSSLIPAQAAQTPQRAAEQPLAARLPTMKPEERIQAVQERVLEHLAAALKTPASRIDVHKPFGALGVDSLLALELVRRLSATTSLSLSATAIFNYPTVSALTPEIERRMSATAGPAPATARSLRASPTPIATELSEQEAILALMKATEPVNR